mmetsp:Transcript_40246/g.38715  ORF Transcript_40246/g.38715 Transcript_40246/m.38715 type:complete len:82 (-) Transcript_40246:55-300(-)
MYVPTYLVLKTRNWKCGNIFFKVVLMTLLVIFTIIFSIPLCFVLVLPMTCIDLKRRDQAKLLKARFNVEQIQRGEKKMYNK